uniref:Mitochondrial ribosomal protein L35 n=1 Tax=Eptatretus burgeri TaxID=7764 RepID=A0A8C4QVE0_EPTBU
MTTISTLLYFLHLPFLIPLPTFLLPPPLAKFIFIFYFFRSSPSSTFYYIHFQHSSHPVTFILPQHMTEPSQPPLLLLHQCLTKGRCCAVQSGYKKRLWRKRPKQRKRLREHILCNKTQSKKLDKMVTSFWKRRRWYVGDPFQMYHDRHNFLP